MQAPPNNDPDQNHHRPNDEDPNQQIPSGAQHDNRAPQLNRANICPNCGQLLNNNDDSDNGCEEISNTPGTLSMDLNLASLYGTPETLLLWIQTIVSHPHTPEAYGSPIDEFFLFDSPDGVGTPSSMAVEPGSAERSMPSSGTLSRSLSHDGFNLMAAAIGFHFEPELVFNPRTPSYFGHTGPLPLIEDPVWPPRRGRALIECVYPSELESDDEEGSVDEDEM